MAHGSGVGMRHKFMAAVEHGAGMPRTVRESEDRIDRCIAFKAAKGADLHTALAALR